MTDAVQPTHDPYEIRLWLPVKLPSGASDTLYTKTIRTAHTPRENARIALWAEIGDQATERWYVQSLVWEDGGQLSATLIPLIANATTEVTERARRTGSGLPWWQGDGPEIGQLLRAAGWTEWGTS
jgi:hypothetical protein